MVKTLLEAEKQFYELKDHKPKATKKLNQLGDILACTYKTNPERADEMWQYLVDLNVKNGDVSNAKFYIAQIFNKLTDRLTVGEATDFITLSPERVSLMLFYGYTGATQWKCLSVLVKGYLSIGAVDDAITCIELFYENLGGIHCSDVKLFDTVKMLVEICLEEIKLKNNKFEAKKLLTELENSENHDLNSFVKVIEVINDYCVIDDFEQLCDIIKEYKYIKVFYDFLWSARSKYSVEYLSIKLCEFIESWEDSDGILYSYGYYSDYVAQELREEKFNFFLDLIKNSEIALECYFNQYNLTIVEYKLVQDWIVESRWDVFIKYISKTILATKKDRFFESSAKKLLEKYMKACLDSYNDNSGINFFVNDEYEVYKLMLKHRQPFSESLVQILLIILGSDCYNSFFVLISEFIQKLNGNVELLNKAGFNIEIDDCTLKDRLKKYAHEFLMSGEIVHPYKSVEYYVIEKGLSDENYYRDDIKFYELALDDEIAKFYFCYFPSNTKQRVNLLSACINKSDINRAYELIDMMSCADINEGYNDFDGWVKQNESTIFELIRKYEIRTEHEYLDITDDMRFITLQLIYRILPRLPDRSQNEIKKQLYRIDKDIIDVEGYLLELSLDVKYYIENPKPRRVGKSRVQEINRISSEIYESFKRLSDLGRLDIIIKIMKDFESVKSTLEPVKYGTWVSLMISGLKNDDLVFVYKKAPEIFNSWFEVDDVRENEIFELIRIFGETHAKNELISFKNMVNLHKGNVEGLNEEFEKFYELNSD